MGCATSCIKVKKKSPIDETFKKITFKANEIRAPQNIQNAPGKSASMEMAKREENGAISNRDLSASEINLLKEIRKAEEIIIRPEGIKFDEFLHNRPVVRISSWNMNNLTMDKVKNPGVMTVVCLTILENRISLIALQEVIHPDVPELIIAELNNPSLSKVKQHRSKGRWRCCVSSSPIGRIYKGSEYGAVLYDETQSITLLHHNILQDSIKSFARKPFIVTVQIEQVKFLIAIFHLKAVDKTNGGFRTQNEISDVALLAEAIFDCAKGHKVLFLGDFNMSADSEHFQPLRNVGLLHLVDPQTPTNTSRWSPNSYDNIWLARQSADFNTGRSGVISEGLSHPQIPRPDTNGWGGLVSDHRPVWADIFARVH